MSEATIVFFVMLLPFLSPILLLLLGSIVGGMIERAHFRSLNRREEALAHITTTNLKKVPEGVDVKQALLVKGDVVVSSDYFKTFLAGLKHLFGGRLRSMESLLERARWEATLRLKEEAERCDATLIINVRYVTTRLRGTMVEVLAYGTAITQA